jgi:predicted transcriptional regulator
MNNRSRTEIVGMILETANSGASNAKIMYNAFLSFDQLKEYLTLLMENDLLEYEIGKQSYRTTKKGTRLLGIYHQIDELVAPVEIY